MTLLKKLTISLFIITFFTTLTYAQAIRVNTFCYTSDFKSKIDEGGPTNPFSNWFVGVGYEQNVGDRIAVSLDLNTSLGKLFADASTNSKDFEYYDAANGYYNSYYYEYASYISYMEFKYQSKYFFNSNNDLSSYISSGIGLKFVNWTFEPSSNNYSVPAEITSYIPTQYIEEKLLVIPLSLRFGGRGSIDGGFGEYFIGASYNLGAGNFPESDVLKNFFDEKPMRGLVFNIGYLWGIGWAD